jgi:hypothetical protein
MKSCGERLAQSAEQLPQSWEQFSLIVISFLSKMQSIKSTVYQFFQKMSMLKISPDISCYFCPDIFCRKWRGSKRLPGSKAGMEQHIHEKE